VLLKLSLHTTPRCLKNNALDWIANCHPSSLPHHLLRATPGPRSYSCALPYQSKEESRLKEDLAKQEALSATASAAVAASQKAVDAQQASIVAARKALALQEAVLQEWEDRLKADKALHGAALRREQELRAAIRSLSLPPT
jgi:hypothetical protein